MGGQRRSERSAHGATGVDRRLADLAARQDGVVSRRQLTAAGLSKGQIDQRVAAGRLHSVFRGVYAVGHPAITDLGRVRAALMAAGPTAAASHRTAGGLLRVMPIVPYVIDVTVTRKGPRSRPGLIVHETSRDLPLTYVGDLPVTAPLRTLADLRPSLSAEAFDALCADALVRRLVTPCDLEPLAPDVAPTRSELERRFRRLVRDAGLPPPAVNPAGNGPMPDFRWSAEGVIVETDGWAAHGSRTAFESDRARDADRVGDGWTVLRFTARQVKRRPEWIVARLAAALSTSGRARSATAGGPTA